MSMRRSPTTTSFPSRTRRSLVCAEPRTAGGRWTSAVERQRSRDGVGGNTHTFHPPLCSQSSYVCRAFYTNKSIQWLFTHRCSLDHNMNFLPLFHWERRTATPVTLPFPTSTHYLLCIRRVFAHPLASFLFLNRLFRFLYCMPLRIHTGLLATTRTQIQTHYSNLRLVHTRLLAHFCRLLQISNSVCFFPPVCLFNAFWSCCVLHVCVSVCCPLLAVYCNYQSSEL